jgi:hypothetical protein
LSIKHVVIFPEFADTEALVETAVFVGLGEQPGGVHKVFALEIFCNLLVPEGDVGLVVVDDGSELVILAEVDHEICHALCAGDEVDDFLLAGLLVEGAGGVLDCLAEDGGQTGLHGGMGE